MFYIVIGIDGRTELWFLACDVRSRASERMTPKGSILQHVPLKTDT